VTPHDLAKALCQRAGYDPEQRITRSIPQQIHSPYGVAYVVPNSSDPAWTLWFDEASRALEILADDKI